MTWHEQPAATPMPAPPVLAATPAPARPWPPEPAGRRRIASAPEIGEPAVSQPAPSFSFRELEARLTGRALAWAGGAALIVGVVFLLSLAFSRGWITPEMRVALGLIGGSIALGIAAWCFERAQPLLGTVLSAVGLGTLSLALYASTRLYGFVAARGRAGRLVRGRRHRRRDRAPLRLAGRGGVRPGRGRGRPAGPRGVGQPRHDGVPGDRPRRNDRHRAVPVLALASPPCLHPLGAAGPGLGGRLPAARDRARRGRAGLLLGAQCSGRHRHGAAAVAQGPGPPIRGAPRAQRPVRGRGRRVPAPRGIARPCSDVPCAPRRRPSRARGVPPAAARRPPSIRAPGGGHRADGGRCRRARRVRRTPRPAALDRTGGRPRRAVRAAPARVRRGRRDRDRRPRGAPPRAGRGSGGRMGARRHGGRRDPVRLGRRPDPGRAPGRGPRRGLDRAGPADPGGVARRLGAPPRVHPSLRADRARPGRRVARSRPRAAGGPAPARAPPWHAIARQCSSRRRPPGGSRPRPGRCRARGREPPGPPASGRRPRPP